MPADRDICYRYDGSLDGLLCCVFDSYARDELPALIASEGDAEGGQVSLFPIWQVRTRPDMARRVSRAIFHKISSEALTLVRLAHLTCLENRESHILRFVRLGFEVGGKVTGLAADPRVDILNRAVNHLKVEQHRYKGFIRFSDAGGALVAQIEPKNFVLPLIAGHFAGRLPRETFMIYDRVHHAALLHQNGQKEIVRLESFTPPPPSGKENQYRDLWRQFYRTVAVEGRENPKCRMNMMPKRYWGMMTEFLEGGQPGSAALVLLR